MRPIAYEIKLTKNSRYEIYFVYKFWFLEIKRKQYWKKSVVIQSESARLSSSLICQANSIVEAKRVAERLVLQARLEYYNILTPRYTIKPKILKRKKIKW